MKSVENVILVLTLYMVYHTYILYTIIEQDLLGLMAIWWLSDEWFPTLVVLSEWSFDLL